MAMPTPAEIQYMMAHTADDKRPNIIAAAAVSLSLAYIAVILRFIGRWRVSVPLLADDWWILVALVCGPRDIAVSNRHHGDSERLTRSE